MPSASGTQHHPQPDETTDPHSTGPDPAADPVLVAERAHLAQAREFLRLMREDVLSLRALGGDRVSEEYLKADLYRRAEALSDLPDTPLFFGRLDYVAGEYAGDRFHVGRRHVHDPAGLPVVVDWRAPVSRAFYRASPAEPMGLGLRRRFGFAGGQLTAHEDEMFTGPDASQAAEARGEPDPDRRDRAAPVRADARHRGHHPAGPGRHRPGGRGPDAVRAGRAGHRQDRGRPAPGGLPAVRLPGQDDPGRRAGHRAEPGLPVLHPQRAARARRAERQPDHAGRPAGPGSGPGHRIRRGGPGQGRYPDGRGAAPRAVGRAARPQPSRCCWPADPAAGGCPPRSSATWLASCASAACGTRRAGTCSATGSRT